MSGMINVVFKAVLSEFLCNFWKTRENIERILMEERVSFPLSFFWENLNDLAYQLLGFDDFDVFIVET